MSKVVDDSKAYGRKKVRQFAMLSLPGALFDYGRFLFESIGPTGGGLSVWDMCPGLLIGMCFCSVWWLGHPSIRICCLYLWLMARDVFLKDREIPKQAWLAAGDRSLWTLPYTAAICSLAWIGLSLTDHHYVDMPGPVSEEAFFGTVAYGIGAWSMFILMRALFQTLQSVEAPEIFVRGKMQVAAVVLGLVVAGNFALVLTFLSIASDDWVSLFPFGTSMPSFSRSVLWYFPESPEVIFMVAGTAGFLIGRSRSERFIPVEIWLFSIVSLATAFCLFGLVMPHLSGMHGMVNAFGETVLRKEGSTRWIDEVIWMLISAAAIIWSVRKSQRKIAPGFSGSGKAPA